METENPTKGTWKNPRKSRAAAKQGWRSRAHPSPRQLGVWDRVLETGHRQGTDETVQL